jgi:hypothetical protein
MSGQYVNMLETLQGFFQRLVEGRRRFLSNQSCEVASVELNNTGVERAVQDVKSQPKESLKPEQAEGLFGPDKGRVGKGNVQVAGNSHPDVGSHILFGGGDGCSSGMFLGMAGLAHGDGDELVRVVHDFAVFNNGFDVSVKPPESQDGLIQFRDMVALQIDLGITSEASRGLVSFYPFVVFQRRADTPFDFAEEGMSVVHVRLYPTVFALIQQGTCTDKHFQSTSVVLVQSGVEDDASEDGFWGMSKNGCI